MIAGSHANQEEQLLAENVARLKQIMQSGDFSQLPEVCDFNQHLKIIERTNPKLLQLDEITLKKINTFFADTTTNKFSKNTDIPFSVIKTKNGNTFAIFSGAIAEGKRAHVKVARNLENGKFCLVKISTVMNGFMDHENKFLEDQGTSFGYQNRKSRGLFKEYIFMKPILGFTLSFFKALLRGFEKKLSRIMQLKILLSAFRELKRLAEKGIVHGDIFDENVMIDPDKMEIILIDYGSATYMSEKKQPEINHKRDISTLLGTVVDLIHDQDLLSKFKHCCLQPEMSRFTPNAAIDQHININCNVVMTELQDELAKAIAFHPSQAIPSLPYVPADPLLPTFKKERKRKQEEKTIPDTRKSVREVGKYQLRCLKKYSMNS